MQQPFSFTTRVQQGDGSLSLHFIEVPIEIAESLSQKFPARALVTIHGATFHGGVLRRKDGYYLIQMGKATLKKIKAIHNDLVEVKIEADQTTYGYELPEEMEALLEQDEDGRKIWEALNPGMKRSLLHYVNSAKSVDVRIKRSIHILKRAEEIQAERKKKGLK
jgi:hypothetical protein